MRQRSSRVSRGGMEQRTFTSEVLAAVTWDAGSNTLDVEFTTGRIYRYWMVPLSVYEGLLHAESPGRYFNAEIRNRFPNREITP
jgi:hypothetical protein